MVTILGYETPVRTVIRTRSIEGARPMGRMIDGVYHTEEDATATSKSGAWERAPSVVRNWITPDGSPGPTGDGGFEAAVGRYHLFVAWNCPWAHRALLARALKKLDGLIGLSVARPNRTEAGWVFDAEGAFSDPLLGASALHEIYAREPGGYTGRVTVPVLWDKARGRMVSNESADIVRMLDTAFEALAPPSPRLAPPELTAEIERWNALIYPTVNNGVYRAGFAATQEAYEQAVAGLFESLDAIDARLADNRYLVGDVFTEADLRLFPTLARFDAAYNTAFKCNIRRLTDYAHLWPYAREIYGMPGVARTVRFDIYRRGYFSRSAKRNPLGIVPLGPVIDWDVPHGRDVPNLRKAG